MATDGGRGQLRQRRHSLFHPIEFGDSANATGFLPHLPKCHDHLRPLPAHRWHFLPLTQAVLQILHSCELFACLTALSLLVASPVITIPLLNIYLKKKNEFMTRQYFKSGIVQNV